MGVGKFVHVVYKAGTVENWIPNFSKSICPSLILFRVHRMSSPVDRPSHSPQPTVPKIAPIFERLTGEELEEILPLVLWPNFDEDNIESFPQGWLGSWGEEEDENLSRILRVCLRASRRRYLLRRDLSRVVEAFYAVVVRGIFFLYGNQD